MLSIHRIAALSAKISKQPDSHWLELTMTEPDGETQVAVTLYFQTRNTGFEEERRFVVELAAAINSLRPMEIGEWGSAKVKSEPSEWPWKPAEPEIETCVACGTTFVDHDPDCPQFDSERK